MAVGSKQYAQRLLWTRISLGIVVLLSLILAHSVWGRIQIEREMAARRAAVETEYEALQERYDDLKERVEELRDDQSAEAELRKYFDVAGEGEQVVIILDDEDEPLAPVIPLAPSSEQKAWWQQLFQ